MISFIFGKFSWGPFFLGTKFLGDQISWEPNFLGTKFFGDQISQGPNFLGTKKVQGPHFWGPNFLGTKFPRAQISWGPNFLGPKKVRGPNEFGDHFSYSLSTYINNLCGHVTNNRAESIKQLGWNFFIYNMKICTQGKQLFRKS